MKKNIAAQLKRYPGMARECFVDGMSYDEANSRLVIHYTNDDGSEGSYAYLEVDPA